MKTHGLSAFHESYMTTVPLKLSSTYYNIPQPKIMILASVLPNTNAHPTPPQPHTHTHLYTHTPLVNQRNETLFSDCFLCEAEGQPSFSLPRCPVFVLCSSPLFKAILESTGS